MCKEYIRGKNRCAEDRCVENIGVENVYVKK